jgi:hypothetical protein
MLGSCDVFEYDLSVIWSPRKQCVVILFNALFGHANVLLDSAGSRTVGCERIVFPLAVATVSCSECSLMLLDPVSRVCRK